jgi:hypothetical protein
MNAYTYNRACSCPRCRIKGLMGAAVLVTLGVLFLLNELWIYGFGQTFPILLIVIGLVMYLGRSASTEGHIEPYEPQPSMGPPPPPPAPNPPGSEVNR